MILYQTLMALALPFVLAHQAVLGAKGAVAERLGLGPSPRPGLTLWLHAASVGEVNSASWVVKTLHSERPDLQILVTTNTKTGRDRVQSWGLSGVTAALAPFDSAGAAGRVLDRWHPQALVIVENELWPARIRAADNRGVPVLVIGARISERSARRWGFGRGLVRQMLGRIAWVSAQDSASLSRLVSLGLPPAACGPVLALKAIGSGTARPAPFAAPAPREKTLLAASTHEGEEALILEAFLAAKAFDHLILAPRHPKRGPQIAAHLRSQNVTFVQRSLNQVPGPGTTVHLADTLGEMDHWYQMAGVTVIGGSFAPKGGHTPWEPTRHGSALLHGPNVQNFAEPYAALDKAGGATEVADAPGLADALTGMDAPAQSRMAQAAAKVLSPSSDGAAVIAKILKTLRG